MRNSCVIEHILRKYFDLITNRTINRCYSIGTKNGDIQTLMKIVKKMSEGSSESINCQFTNAVIQRRYKEAQRIFNQNSNQLADSIVDICYVIAAQNGDIQMLMRFSKKLSEGSRDLSINCEFTNAVIERRLGDAQRIFNQHLNQLEVSIVNISYVIAIKNGDICFAFKLSGHPKFKFKSHWNAWNKTAFRDESKRLRHVDYIQVTWFVLV